MQPQLSKSDIDLLKSIIYQARRSSPQPLHRYGPEKIEHEEQMAPQVYVALTPEGGIPALTLESHTGTGTYVDGYPGYADCDIYRISLLTDPDNPLLTNVTNVVREVYNIGTSAIPGDTWVLISRDAYGFWIAHLGGISTRYVLLTDKTFSGLTPIYSWVGVTNTSGSTYELDGTSGGPGDNPLYHQRNRDLPVVPHYTTGTGSYYGTGALIGTPFFIDALSVVQVWQGSDHLLFDTEPYSDLIYRTGVFDANGEIAYFRRYDQATQTWQLGRELRLVESE